MVGGEARRVKGLKVLSEGEARVEGSGRRVSELRYLQQLRN